MSHSVTGRMDWNGKLADVLVKYCQPDVIKLLAWNSMITFRKVILKAARNQGTVPCQVDSLKK